MSILKKLQSPLAKKILEINPQAQKTAADLVYPVRKPITDVIDVNVERRKVDLADI